MIRLPALVVLAWCLAVWHRMPPPAILHLAQGRDDLFFSRHGVPRSGEWTLQWFSDNWDLDLPWPRGIPWPAPADDSPFMHQVADMLAVGLDHLKDNDHSKYAQEVYDRLQGYKEFQGWA